MIKHIKKHRHTIRNVVLLCISAGLVCSSVIILWVGNLKIPNTETIRERRISESTKIFDRTGKILLHDTGGDVHRESVPLSDISINIQNATIAIEDREFYSHNGVKPISFARAILVNLLSFDFSQGGSTITQQVVKNSLLTSDKLISRKIKEWVIAIKLEKSLSKEEILSMYLNEIPYGGVLYGVEEASNAFFGKSAKDVGLAEAAYLAALPKAPSYYSPFGQNIDKLEARKNLVLREMLSNGFIDQGQYDSAVAQKVVFLAKSVATVKAPHFVFFVLDKLKSKYGEEGLKNRNLSIITTLDYDLQMKAEKTALEYALKNKVAVNAENAGILASNPKTGEILTMVGSRNYFDKEIDGAYNVTTAKRQPGSTFKPIVYAEAFTKGYTPETILFDVPTQFSVNCSVDSTSSENGCYAPHNFDDKYRGPITLRNSLAESRNITSVKTLYLAGVNDSIRLAKDMGVETLGSKSELGLTLVLGGGEVTLLEMVTAYGVFANYGDRVDLSPILEIKDKDGNTLEKLSHRRSTVLDREITLKISSILSDNEARTPTFGPSSAMNFGSRDVAVKTGTTDNNKDAWIIGYTPSLVVGAWAGNNDNTPMKKNGSASALWREFTNYALTKVPREDFEDPLAEDPVILKPVLKGIWAGGVEENGNFTGGTHSILYWIDKDHPRGDTAPGSISDGQFNNWEFSVRRWAAENGFQ